MENVNRPNRAELKAAPNIVREIRSFMEKGRAPRAATKPLQDLSSWVKQIQTTSGNAAIKSEQLYDKEDSDKPTLSLKMAKPIDLTKVVEIAPLVGFLVPRDSEQAKYFELRPGRCFVSVAPQGDNVIHLNDKSISKMHATLQISSDGNVKVSDQLSDCGTWHRPRQSAQAERIDKPTALSHGDEISFGAKKFVVCLIPNSETPQN